MWGEWGLVGGAEWGLAGVCVCVCVCVCVLKLSFFVTIHKKYRTRFRNISVNFQNKEERANCVTIPYWALVSF
jgi:hypothetical protein